MAGEAAIRIFPVLPLEEVEMNFCLTYDGPLPANPTGKKPSEIKHRIRQRIGSQLKDLIEHHDHALTDAIHKYVRLGRFAFIPLVTSELHMACELDILFLRRERPGALMTKPKDEYGGDLDNRLKIFLDALRMPREPKEFPTSLGLTDDNVLYCLLEDDALITKFQVESATLLGEQEGDPKDVRLITRVTVKLTRSTDANRNLGI